MLEEVFVVAPGPSGEFLEIFSFPRRVPVFKKVEDRSPIASEVKFSAYTGLQEC